MTTHVDACRRGTDTARAMNRAAINVSHNRRNRGVAARAQSKKHGLT
jgi:hypothetical protein